MDLIYLIFFNIYFIIITNKFIKFISCNPDESNNSQNNFEFIGLDFGRFVPNNFEIVKSNEGPESYKITPKAGKKLDLINLWIDIIWIKNEFSECKSVTIYNTTLNEFLIVLNIVEQGIEHSLHYIKNQNLTNLSVVEFLDLNNEDFRNMDLNRRVTLDISDNFDKIFYDYTIKTHGDDTYETFDVYDDDIFVKINEGKSYTIWDNDIGATRLELYKRNDANLLMKITIDQHSALFMIYRDDHIRWDYINEKDFYMIFDSESLRKFDYVETDPKFYIVNTRLKRRIDLDNEDFIDISKYSRFCRYDSSNIMDVLYVVITPINQFKTINKIIQGMTIIHEGILKNASVTFVKTHNNIYYVEITSSCNESRLPNIYYTKTSDSTPWIKMNQQEFHKSFVNNVILSKIPTYLKYFEIYGLINGTKIHNFPEHINDKIQMLLISENSYIDTNFEDSKDRSITSYHPTGNSDQYPELDYIFFDGKKVNGDGNKLDVLNKPIVTQSNTMGTPKQSLTKDTNTPIELKKTTLLFPESQTSKDKTISLDDNPEQSGVETITPKITSNKKKYDKDVEIEYNDGSKVKTLRFVDEKNNDNIINISGFINNKITFAISIIILLSQMDIILLDQLF